MSSPRRRRRHAVFCLAVLPGWQPSSPWSFPPEATGAKLLGRYATPHEAVAVCRTHNRAQLQRVYHRQPVQSWLVACLYLRPRKEVQQAKGGASC